MELQVQLAILFLDAKEPAKAMTHLRLAIGEANKRRDNAMKSDLFAVLNGLRKVLQ